MKKVPYNRAHSSRFSSEYNDIKLALIPACWPRMSRSSSGCELHTSEIVDRDFIKNTDRFFLGAVNPWISHAHFELIAHV
jgi:hypothetical protein